jgi:hypothetical protein
MLGLNFRKIICPSKSCTMLVLKVQSHNYCEILEIGSLHALFNLKLKQNHVGTYGFLAHLHMAWCMHLGSIIRGHRIPFAQSESLKHLINPDRPEMKKEIFFKLKWKYKIVYEVRNKN